MTATMVGLAQAMGLAGAYGTTAGALPGGKAEDALLTGQ